RLEIQGLGVVDLSSEIAVDDPRIEENREAFRKMQKWVRMLPNLQELTVSVYGADEELIQGFLGIEDQDKEENEGAWASEAIEDADETFGIERSRVGIRGSAVALPAPAVSRTLVGPRLEVLRIWELKQGGLEASEIDRFVKNYPGLKTAYAYGPGRDMPEPPMDTITRIDPLTLPEIVDIIAPFLDRKQSLASAARVCKAWNRLYTPHLWRKLSIGSRDSAALNFARHGTHVRQLYLDTLEDSDFDLIAPFCPNIESLALILCKITLERLASYLRTLAPRLKRLRVKTAMACADKLISVLGAESPHQDGGANGGSALEDLRLVFDLFRGELVEISLDALMGLLEARPGLKKISIKWASIRDADAMSSNNRSLGSSMDVAMPMAEELDDGRGLQDNGFVETQSALTHLSFLAAEIEERTLVRLLGKTPRLASLHIHSNDFLTGDFLTALPTLCPELTHLTMEMCRSIPGSAYMRLFQSSSSSPGHRTLHLEFLRLELCNLDDQSLQYLASTQGDTLLELDLRYCKNVTDSGVMAMLSGCHRLTSLSIYGTSNVSVAIMMEDGPAERWSCYKSLKRLEIHGLGVVELPSRHAEDDPRIEQNREAFRK
ncbi:hypothetical protein BGX29_003944, partial [Mortierella sp. GBA35]